MGDDHLYSWRTEEQEAQISEIKDLLRPIFERYDSGLVLIGARQMALSGQANRLKREKACVDSALKETK